MTTAAGTRRGWVKPFLFGVLGFVVAAVVTALVVGTKIYRDQGDAYCEAIAQSVRQAEAQGPALEPHAARQRQKLAEECG